MSDLLIGNSNAELTGKLPDVAPAPIRSARRIGAVPLDSSWARTRPYPDLR
jgi:hypothetical protein